MQPAGTAQPGAPDRKPAPHRPRRPGRTAPALGVATGCYAVAVSVLGTTTSLFLADAVGAGPGLIGLYFIGCAAAAVGVNLVTGQLSDRLEDRRTALAVTALAGVVGAAVFAAARNYAAVFATGAVLISLNDGYISQLFAYVKDFADSTGRELTPFSSAVRSLFSVGWVVGPPAGLFLLVHLGFGPVYAGVAGLLLATAVLGRWFLPALAPPRPPVAGGPARERRPGLRRVLATVPRRTWLLLGAVTAVNVADQVYLIDIALYVTRDLHRSAALAGLLAGVCAVLEIPLMLLVGRFADRVGKTRLVACAVLLATAFFGLLPLAGSPAALIALQLPNALWTAVLAGLPMVIVQREVPGGSGTASSLHSSTFPVAQLLAGAVTGTLAARTGYRDVFWICAGLCALAAACLLGRALTDGTRETRADTTTGR
ncbi:sugar efflux transporter [Kitasatospora sp. NPDC057198]|uniref:sugar efflux transporter n=1 Tax=Kitasatospora sp. NPDC057198 TaxID=3346046 RepID=UPI003645AB2C